MRLDHCMPCSTLLVAVGAPYLTDTLDVNTQEPREMKEHTCVLSDNSRKSGANSTC